MLSRTITTVALVAALSATTFVAATNASAAPTTCEAHKITDRSMKSLCLLRTPRNGHYAEARLQFDSYAAYRHSDISQGPWPVVVR